MRQQKILFISEAGPLPNTDGKRQRTYALVSSLSQKFNVDFLILGDLNSYRLAQSKFTGKNLRFLFLPNPPSLWYHLIYKMIGYSFYADNRLKTAIARLLAAENYEFVFSRYIGPVAHLPEGVKIVCDVDDDFHEINKTKIRQSRNVFRKIRFTQIYFVNILSYLFLLKRVDKRITVNSKNSKNSLYLPNLPFQVVLNGNLKLVSCSNSVIVYVGKLSYLPNEEGLSWFLQKVWPLLIAKMKITLVVVSSADSSNYDLNRLISTSPGVNYLGKVETLTDVYHSSAAVVAPVFQGSGTSIKVAEALLFGRPVFTNKFGARGYDDAVAQGQILIAEDPSVFANNIASFFLSRADIVKRQETIFTQAAINFSIGRWNSSLMDFLNFDND
jgi:hypothetical protein